MAICNKCGMNLADGTQTCPGCGTPLAQQNTDLLTNLSSKISGFNNTADTTASYDRTDIEQNKVMAILSYFSLLVLVPIFAAPTSKFARFHANQGLLLLIVEVAWWIIQIILTVIIYAISWRLGFLTIILSLVNIPILILVILGIVNAANGKAKELPLIGKIRLIK